MTRALDGVLAGGGEMGQRIRDFDWAATPLGAIETWPQSLLTSLSLILNAQMPMWLGWGRELYFFYNDAYVQVLSHAKHPSALGRPAEEVWREIWDVCGPLASAVLDRAEAPFVEDVRLFMNRGGGFMEEVYYSFSYSPIRDESGRVGGLFCPNTEVTAKLLHTRRLRTLSELSAKAFVEKTIETACASAAETLAKNPDDVPFALIYRGDGPVLHECAGLDFAHEQAADRPWPIADVFATGKGVRSELAPDATLPRGLADQPIREVLTLPIATGNQTLGVLVAGVNPARRLDTEYMTFFELVAAQVAIAIQNALAAEETKHRADMLAEIDRAKTVFFSNVSHEFRTPLTLMIGPTEDALGMPDRALAGDSLETVYRNQLRLLKLVNALLDFSRLEAGRMQAAYETVELGTFTADLASGFRSAIERAGLALTVDIAPLSGPTAVDRDMWEKIVLNLLSNALKFTLEGSIRIGLRPVADTIELTVADTGTGIPPEELPRLFERFHRIENAKARTHEGSGIGLALVHELVRLHGGTIAVDSTVGRGTTFTVVIPRRAATRETTGRRTSATLRAHVEEAQRWAPDEPSAAAQPSDAPHVLLADDNADMRDYLRRLLKPEMRVTAVPDGNAALAALHDKPDIIVSDVMMPGLDGFGLLAAVRANPATAAIPVILVSARAGDEARLEGLGAGADDYLVKPFSARELVARVRTHLALAQERKRSDAARETALAASRAKDEFLAMLGHELRNPLAPIVTALELMKLRGDLAETARATIERQVRHLTRLVDDLLDISRVTRGLIELEREQLSMRDVIAKAIEIASPLIERKAHHLTVDVPATLSVDGDPIRLAQIFANLLTNAARYTERGGHIHVTAERAGNRAIVRVSDDGIGIAPELVERIFDLFVQGGNRGAARSEGGLGIGLALVRNLVTLHGGTVTASSDGAGRGSTFTVDLTAVDGPVAGTGPRKAITAALQGRRVLVVDDNEDAAEMLGAALRHFGHDVMIVHDAAQALAAAEAFAPQAAVLDIGLPVMDGYELARRLRVSVAPCLLIALTGYGQDTDRARSTEAGFDAHMVKPVDLQELASVLEVS